MCGCSMFDMPMPGRNKSVPEQISDASLSIANQLATNLTTEQKLRVGILPFSQRANDAHTLTQAMEESLKNKLFLTRKFDIVEDDDMNKVLQELKLQEQGEGILRQDTIHRVGELLGVDAIVVGTLTKMNNSDVGSYGFTYMIYCRLVPIRSGVVGSVGEAYISPEKYFIPLDNRGQPNWNYYDPSAQ